MSAPQFDPAPGALRVRDWNPFHLGVHKPVPVDGAQDLPRYFRRDHDAELSGELRKMAASGGFVLMVGQAATGKSRSAYQAVLAELPDWQLVPPKAGAVPNRVPARTVLWLDELRLYLEATEPLTVDVLRDLLSAPDPVVVISTVWSSYHSLVDDSWGQAYEIIKLAKIIPVLDFLSDREQEAAQAAAREDASIAAALEVTDYGLIQILAGARGLLERWHGAKPLARALISAAVDAYMLGVRSPVPREFLIAAAPGYLTGKAKLATDIAAAFAEATKPLRDTDMAPLTQVGTPMDGEHYLVAECLTLESMTRQRPMRAIPAATWSAIADHVTNAEELLVTGKAAESRMLYRVAERLYERSRTLEGRLRTADLLANRGLHTKATESLRDLVEKDNVEAIRWTVQHSEMVWPEATVVRTKLLKRLVGITNDDDDRLHLARVLHQSRDPDALNHWLLLAERNAVAARRAAGVLAHEPERAVALLRPWADRGDIRARDDLRQILIARGDIEAIDAMSLSWDADEFAETLARRDARIELLRLADRGNQRARQLIRDQPDAIEASARWARGGDVRERLAHANLLAWSNRPDEAIDVLKAMVADVPDNDDAETLLTDLLTDAGRVDDLCALADAGSDLAGMAAAQLLRTRGEIDVLARRAEAGDFAALQIWSDWLRDEGRPAEAFPLWEAAVEADPDRTRARYGEFLELCGRVEEALEIALQLSKTGDRDARSAAATQMAMLERWDDLCDLAEKGDRYADIEYVRHLLANGDYPAVRKRATAGSPEAIRRLQAADEENIPAVRGISVRGLEPDGTLGQPL
ncbi:hypothetical protein [Actinocrispum sp. NPDC049592]|uniref:tetratricopeptide repeat protein n=1 Tax=Actinocrispum sp. NPDC049592 TaxID=3154835 RepID=UPI00341C3305